jgi:hypothetical protein
LQFDQIKSEEYIDYPVKQQFEPIDSPKPEELHPYQHQPNANEDEEWDYDEILGRGTVTSFFILSCRSPKKHLSIAIENIIPANLINCTC